jgi:hypothetical protein
VASGRTGVRLLDEDEQVLAAGAERGTAIFTPVRARPIASS